MDPAEFQNVLLHTFSPVQSVRAEAEAAIAQLKVTRDP